MPCLIDGCERSGKLKRGMCEMHYQRWYFHGDASHTRPGAEDRLWRKVEKQGGGCWLWTGRPNGGGYGRIAIGGGSHVYVHRFAYELTHGPIPDGLTVDHECHTKDESCVGGPTCPHRRCVNPAHLVAVTRGENTLRGNSPFSINAAKTHCIRNHPLSGDNVRWYKGHRECRACDREWYAEKKLSAAVK